MQTLDFSDVRDKLLFGIFLLLAVKFNTNYPKEAICLRKSMFTGSKAENSFTIHGPKNSLKERENSKR